MGIEGESTHFQNNIQLEIPKKFNRFTTICELQVFPSPTSVDSFRDVIIPGHSNEESRFLIELKLLLGEKCLLTLHGQTIGDMVLILYQGENLLPQADTSSIRRSVSYVHMEFLVFTQEAGWQERKNVSEEEQY